MLMRAGILLTSFAALSLWSGCGGDDDSDFEYHEDDNDRRVRYDDDDYDDEDRDVDVDIEVDYDEPDTRVVYVEAGHRHSVDCGHYYDGRSWLTLDIGHHHGPGCGHAYTGRYWVLRRPVVVGTPVQRRVTRVRHIHSATCGCAYDTGVRRWVSVPHGHVHGPRCGHVYRGNRWTIVRRR